MASKPPEARGKAWERILPQSPVANNCGTINFHHLSHPIWGAFLCNLSKLLQAEIMALYLFCFFFLLPLYLKSLA